MTFIALTYSNVVAEVLFMWPLINLQQSMRGDDDLLIRLWSILLSSNSFSLCLLISCKNNLWRHQLSDFPHIIECTSACLNLQQIGRAPTLSCYTYDGREICISIQERLIIYTSHEKVKIGNPQALS